MNIAVKVRCPYCGQENDIWMTLNSTIVLPDIVTCNEDDIPGCGREFVVRTKVNVDVKTFKIEGEEE